MHAFVISARETGRTLCAVLKSRLGLSWAQTRTLIASGQMQVNGQVCSDSVRRMHLSDRVEPRKSNRLKRTRRTRPDETIRRPTGCPVEVVYSDDAVVVVNKPPGLTTMRHAVEAAEFGARGRRYLPKTLADQLALLFPSQLLRAVHRLDRDTSGLVVFARTPEAERHLGRQFRAHTVSRRYLAIVRSRPADTRVESWLVRDRGDGRRGSGDRQSGQRAVTHVRVIEALGPCSFIECRLETGRTHQIRIHLGELGSPLAGETIYDRPIQGSSMPDPSGAPRIALHAAALGFTHPVSGLRLQWESALPPDMNAVLQRLRQDSRRSM
jgi:23S rRNA pseudouridine1911/1915/1917 synthase